HGAGGAGGVHTGVVGAVGDDHGAAEEAVVQLQAVGAVAAEEAHSQGDRNVGEGGDVIPFAEADPDPGDPAGLEGAVGGAVDDGAALPGDSEAGGEVRVGWSNGDLVIGGGPDGGDVQEAVTHAGDDGGGDSLTQGFEGRSETTCLRARGGAIGAEGQGA